ncbi:MAG: PstC family ABC transporter permease [Nitrospinota bacterium]
MSWRSVEQRLALGLLFASGLVVVVINLAIFIFIFSESTPLFSESEQRNDMSLYHDTENEEQFDRTASVFQPLDNMLGQPVWQPVSDQGLYSLWPLAVGTFKITIIAVVIAWIFSFFAAIGIAFYLPKSIRYGVKVMIELLAGIPSVVLGFLGLMFFASYMQDIFGFTYRLNALLCGTVLSLTVIPIMTTLFEDLYSAYPKDQILAAKSAGLYDYQIIRYIIVPASFGRVLAATMLGFGRCFGETMIVLMCSGNAAILSLDLASGARSFAATIGAEMAEVIIGDTHYSILFLIGLILFMVTFLINYISQLVIKRLTYV